jgi:hypothetical protein
MSQIKTLTADQEQRLGAYRERWLSQLHTTQPLDHARSSEAIHRLYDRLGKSAPQIRFLAGPTELHNLTLNRSTGSLVQQLGVPVTSNYLSFELLEEVQSQLDPNLQDRLHEALSTPQLQQVFLQRQIPLLEQVGELSGEDWEELLSRVPEQMLMDFWAKQQRDFRDALSQQPGGDLILDLGDWFLRQMQPLTQQFEANVWAAWMRPGLEELVVKWQPLLTAAGLVGFGLRTLIQIIQDLPVAFIDFCVTELNCRCDRSAWDVLKHLIEDCGIILPFEKTCLVLERPLVFRLDDRGNLHGEGEPAIVYADGYTLYAFHGAILPLHYAELHPHQWQSQWLLTEPNAELRRALIQGIGYARLCQELQAKELDQWREYTLLEIEQEVDVESIVLLKMTCPSTGYIHTIRVPPEIRSAREAIRWVNWDTDPIEFAVET